MSEKTFAAICGNTYALISTLYGTFKVFVIDENHLAVNGQSTPIGTRPFYENRVAVITDCHTIKSISDLKAAVEKATQRIIIH